MNGRVALACLLSAVPAFAEGERFEVTAQPLAWEDVSEHFALVVQKTLFKDPVERYIDCEQLLEDLKATSLTRFVGPDDLRRRTGF